MTGNTDEPLTTIRFELPPDAWHGYESEQVWAEVVDGGFVVRNSPFFVKDLSVEDTVAALLDGDGFRFDHIVERGGHSTYRLIMLRAGDQLDEALARLLETGCTWEVGPNSMLAVDVPPDADIHTVYNVLTAASKDGLWDFEEGHVGHQV